MIKTANSGNDWAMNPPLSGSWATAPMMPAAEAHGIRELIDEHSEFLWRGLRRLGVGENGVDDALQQVFWTASRKLGDIAPGKERAFLFGIAIHVAAHARRTHARRKEVANEDELLAVLHQDGGAQSPEDDYQDAQARALLDIVLGAMPDELRTVFALYELEEASTAEIASLLEIPIGTVASRLRRARELFQAESERLQKRLARQTPKENAP